MSIFIEKNSTLTLIFIPALSLKQWASPPLCLLFWFAIARTTVGWIAQWKEMIADPSKIGRPRQLYTGVKECKYKPISER